VVDESAERPELALTTTRDDTSVLVAVTGELDAYSTPSLEGLVGSLQAEGCVNFTLDLSQTTFIDSSGLRALLALHTRLSEGATGGLALQSPSGPVTRLLTITGLTQHFRLT
jgi:anti-sigma B factor antagonist